MARTFRQAKQRDNIFFSSKTSLGRGSLLTKLDIRKREVAKGMHCFLIEAWPVYRKFQMRLKGVQVMKTKQKNIQNILEQFGVSDAQTGRGSPSAIPDQGLDKPGSPAKQVRILSTSQTN